MLQRKDWGESAGVSAKTLLLDALAPNGEGGVLDEDGRAKLRAVFVNLALPSSHANARVLSEAFGGEAEGGKGTEDQTAAAARSDDPEETTSTQQV